MARNARDYSAEHTLKDGVPVTISAVTPADRPRILEAFRLLGNASIYTRYFNLRGELSEAELDRAMNVDFVRNVTLVVSTETSAGETIIATGRYVASDMPDADAAAEVTFVVAEDYQGRGIASRLLASLVDIARGQGLARFHADVLARNHPMLAVFKRCGLPLRQEREGGVVHVTLDLAADEGGSP